MKETGNEKVICKKDSVLYNHTDNIYLSAFCSAGDERNVGRATGESGSGGK